MLSKHNSVPEECADLIAKNIFITILLIAFLVWNGCTTTTTKPATSRAKQMTNQDGYQSVNDTLDLSQVLPLLDTNQSNQNTAKPRKQLKVDNYYAEPKSTDEEYAYNEYIKANAPSDSAFGALQRLASVSIKQGNHKAAVELYERYQSLFPNRQTTLKTILGILKEEYPHYVVRNMGSAFNTVGDEFMPVPATVNYPMRLWFTSANRKDNRNSEEVMYSEFQYVSWTTAVSAPSPFNTFAGESVSSLLDEGGRMAFTRNAARKQDANLARIDKDTSTNKELRAYAKKTKHNANIYTASGRFLTWRAIQELPPPINSPYFDGDAQIIDRGRAIMFTSDRPGGIGEFRTKPTPADSDYHGDRWGNTDIYVTVLTPDGKWSKPINLGATINTPYAERTPYFSADGKTLYFASEGHPGLGRMDIYRSERKDMDSWTEWTLPENLGKEINSADDDWGLSECANSDSVFFASRNRVGGFGGLDIYSAKLAPPPPRFTTVRGLITDYYSKPLVTDIRFMDATDDPYFVRIKSDSLGNFEARLPRGRDYLWLVKKEGYYPLTKNFRIRNTDADSIIDDLNIQIMPLHDNPELDTSVLHIENILFEYNSVVVRDKYLLEMQNIADYVTKRVNFFIEITGHTDNGGAVEYNKILSRRRAEAVRKFLVELGVVPNRIRVNGAGTLKPLANNDSEEGRALNRRVEIRLRQ